jgi:hypothetical protein
MHNMFRMSKLNPDLLASNENGYFRGIIILSTQFHHIMVSILLVTQSAEV